MELYEINDILVTAQQFHQKFLLIIFYQSDYYCHFIIFHKIKFITTDLIAIPNLNNNNFKFMIKY